jgi:hypothetical protein
LTGGRGSCRASSIAIRLKTPRRIAFQKSPLADVYPGPAIGDFCRKFERPGGKTVRPTKKSEKKRLRVDAFWQKPYRPARQSTASTPFAENLT